MLPLAPHSQVVLYLKEQMISVILPRSQKPDWGLLVRVQTEQASWQSLGSLLLCALSSKERGLSLLDLVRAGG